MELAGEHRVAAARAADVLQTGEGDETLPRPEARAPAGLLPGAAAAKVAGQFFGSFQQYLRPDGTPGE